MEFMGSDRPLQYLITIKRKPNQCMFLSLIPSWKRFVYMFLRHIKRLSRYIPKYFTSSSWDKFLLFRLTEGQVQVSLLNAKVTLCWLAFIRFYFPFFNPMWNLGKVVLKICWCYYRICMGITTHTWKKK